MSQDLPARFFVVKSPFAVELLTGGKNFEFRTNAKTFANKRLAVAVSKQAVNAAVLEDDLKYWENWSVNQCGESKAASTKRKKPPSPFLTTMTSWE